MALHTWYTIFPALCVLQPHLDRGTEPISSESNATSAKRFASWISRRVVWLERYVAMFEFSRVFEE